MGGGGGGGGGGGLGELVIFFSHAIAFCAYPADYFASKF